MKSYVPDTLPLIELDFRLLLPLVGRANAELARYLQQCEALRAKGKPTVPSTIGRELQINPFLRVREPALQQAAQARSHSAAVQTCILPVGHQQMSEAPEGTLRAIRSFLNSHPSH